MNDMEDELIAMNILIADRTYRIKLDPKDEAVVRASVKLINDKITEFKKNFVGKDMQDYVSMVLIWFATEQTKPGKSLIAEEETAQKLTQLEALLDKLIVQ